MKETILASSRGSPTILHKWCKTCSEDMSGRLSAKIIPPTKISSNVTLESHFSLSYIILRSQGVVAMTQKRHQDS